MAQIDIGADTYDSFSDEDFNDTYVAADPSASAAWADLDQDGRNQISVTTSRILKRQPWTAGAPSFETTPLVVQEANGEFIIAVLLGYDLGVDPASILPVKRQKAGSVEVEYFSNLDKPTYMPPPLPRAVWELIRSLIIAPAAEGWGLPGAIASGTCGESITQPDRIYDRSDYIGGGSERDFN